MRLLNRLLAALLSIALIVAGVLLIIEVIADRVHHRPAIVQWHRSYDWAGRTTWQAGSVRVACIALIIVGLALLLVESRRPSISRLPVSADASDSSPIDTAYTRRGVAATIRSAVADVDGIRSARVRVKRHSIRVRAVAAARDKQAIPALREVTDAAARRRLETLALTSSPSLSVRVIPRSS